MSLGRMLSDEHLKEILVGQREKFLKKSFGVERTILREIRQKMRLPHVVVITGLRRSGKSTLLRQITKTYYRDTDFYYVSFEDERLLNFPAAEFQRIYEALVSLWGAKKTFFIDEIQNIAGFESFVRRFTEEGFKFFITGSSASLLSNELGTKLTGRHVDLVVKPFSFLEFLTMKGVAIERETLYRTESKIALKKHAEEYLTCGGMPEYLLYNDPEILMRVYEDIIIKDIAVRYAIENVSALRELYQYLIATVANKFSYHSLKKMLGVGSVNTVKKYISYLQDTYFATTINKFDYSLKKQLVNDKKPYIVDNGFITVLSKKLTKDAGWILENLVFNTLSPEHKVFYYTGKRECDFLLVRNKSVERAVQVCYELNNENREREIEGLCEAIKVAKKTMGTIVTMNQEDEFMHNEMKIRVRPLWKWLLEI